MGAKAAPMGSADRVEEGAPPLSLARAVEEEGEESGTPSSRGTPVSFQVEK